jgi:hypothetical protein
VRHNDKAGRRRLKEMSPDLTPGVWSPKLPPEEPYEQRFLISSEVAYYQRIGYDELGRVADWAVIQQRRVAGEWRKVVVYDACHGKGVHKCTCSTDWRGSSPRSRSAP